MWKRAIIKVTKLRRTDQVQVEIRIIVFFMNVYIVRDAVFLYLTLCKCNYIDGYISDSVGEEFVLFCPPEALEVVEVWRHTPTGEMSKMSASRDVH